MRGSPIAVPDPKRSPPPGTLPLYTLPTHPTSKHTLRLTGTPQNPSHPHRLTWHTHTHEHTHAKRVGNTDGDPIPPTQHSHQMRFYERRRPIKQSRKFCQTPQVTSALQGAHTQTHTHTHTEVSLPPSLCLIRRTYRGKPLPIFSVAIRPSRLVYLIPRGRTLPT